jgi:hypothetical protein
MLALISTLLLARADAPITADANGSKPVIGIEIGEVHVRDTPNRFFVRDLDVSHCVVRPEAANTPVPRAAAATDSILLDVVVRHHSTERVTISAIDPGYAWVEPCIEREVFTHRWPIRDGRLEVPINVARPNADPREPIVVVAPPPPR